MKITIEIESNELTCVEVVRAITHSRLNARDDAPMQSNEWGVFRDINGNSIGTWYTSYGKPTYG